VVAPEAVDALVEVGAAADEPQAASAAAVTTTTMIRAIDQH
jgi:hypothetical protein